MICLYFVHGELPTLVIYSTRTSREIDRLSREKIMPPVFASYERNINMHKIHLFKVKNTDFWVAYGVSTN